MKIQNIIFVVVVVVRFYTCGTRAVLNLIFVFFHSDCEISLFPSSIFSFLFLSAAQVPHSESKQLDPLLGSGGGMYKLDGQRPDTSNEPQPLQKMRVSMNPARWLQTEHAGLFSVAAQPFDGYTALFQNRSYYPGCEPVTHFSIQFLLCSCVIVCIYAGKMFLV